MKKALFVLLLAAAPICLMAQENIKTYIIGIWQISSMYSGNFDIDYETGEIYPGESSKADIASGKAGAQASFENLKKDLKRTMKTHYYEFDKDNGFSYFEDGNFINGTYEIKAKTSDSPWELVLQYGDKLQKFAVSMKETSTKTMLVMSPVPSSDEDEYLAFVNISTNYKKLEEEGLAAVKNGIDYKNAANAKAQEKEDKIKKIRAENARKLVQARENSKIADRLKSEETTTNKLYRSNLSLAEVAETVYKKLKAGKMNNLIKNEHIDITYYDSPNLYMTTLTVKQAKETFISDYEGAKTFTVYFNEADDVDDLSNDFYAYVDQLKKWTSNNGTFIESEERYGHCVYLTSGDLKIEINLFLSGNVDKYILEVSFSKP